MNLKKLVYCLTALFSIKAVYAQTSFAPLVEELMPTVVNISTDVKTSVDAPNVLDNLIFEEENRETLGSGFIVDVNGYIATNFHVIENASKISVITSDGKAFDAKLVGQDLQTDVALIKIEPKEPLSAVVFGDSDIIKAGDWVLAIGNPFGLGNSVTTGIISAKSRDISDNPYTTYLQTDASINKGNSGGPMFNINGELIGINTAIFSSSGDSIGVGFALPSNEVKWILDELIQNGNVQRSWLGVELKKATTKDGVSGLVITSFVDMSVAKKNNFEIGDMILEYNSQKIDSLKDFSYNISKMKSLEKTELTLWRNGKTIKQEVQVELMPTDKNSSLQIEKNKSGKYFQELGVYLNVLEITGFDKNSDLGKKGAQVGDKIVKINDHVVYGIDDAKNLLEEAKLDGLLLKIELTDAENKEYFIELKQY